MSPLLSIILPVYNVEAYIVQCLNSILAQTFTDYELIIVNDGSQDSCLEICEDFKKKDLRIKVMNQENRGPSGARNTGLKSATGKYIAFIDSDDLIDKNSFNNYIAAIQLNKADLVIGGYKTNLLNKIIIPNYKKECILNPREFIESNNKIHSKNDMSFAWRFLFKREMLEINKIFFNEEIKIGEDFIFNLEAVMNAKRIFVLDGGYYSYRVDNQTSLMKTKYKSYLEETLTKQYEEKVRLTEQYELDKILSWKEDMAYYYTVSIKEMLLNNLFEGPEKNKIKGIKRIMNMKMFKNSYKYLGFKGDYSNWKSFIVFLFYKFNFALGIYYFRVRK